MMDDIKFRKKMMSRLKIVQGDKHSYKEPMFDSTPPNPFPGERKKRIGGLSVRQKAVIRDLSRQKISVQTIAAKAGCSVMSVYRYREEDTENDGAGSP